MHTHESTMAKLPRVHNGEINFRDGIDVRGQETETQAAANGRTLLNLGVLFGVEAKPDFINFRG